MFYDYLILKSKLLLILVYLGPYQTFVIGYFWLVGLVNFNSSIGCVLVQ